MHDERKAGKVRLEGWINALAQLRRHFPGTATLDEMAKAVRAHKNEITEENRRRRDAKRLRFPITIAMLLTKIGLLERQGTRRRQFYDWLADEGLLYDQHVVGKRTYPVKSTTAKAVRMGYATEWSPTQNEWTEKGLRVLMDLFMMTKGGR